MEKTQEKNKEVLLRELASHPATALSFMRTMFSALEMCHEVLYDLTWERGGKLDPIQEEYVVKLNRIVSEILEKQED
jgi:hypothetical protein